MNKTFQIEIQALRAFAVISVLLFHLGIKFFEGGFLGVDIFFAITGYLITKSIFESGGSIFNFYIKRIKRVLPALIILILFCYLFVTLFFHPSHSNHFYNSIYFTSTFTSNFYFWLKSQDYFNIASYYQPLLHTWSLSLEVQFYLTFPLIFLILKKLNNNQIIFFLIFLIFSSLILSILFIGREQSFYLLPYRFCEFATGSICFFLKKNKNSELNDFISILAFIFLILVILSFTNVNFPGIKGFIVSFLTSLIIHFNSGRIFKNFCQNFMVQRIGLISYSLFLFHWPIIIFYKYLTFGELKLFDYITIVLISFVLSHLSYEFVEKKFNKLKVDYFFFKIKYLFGSLVLLFLLTIFFKSEFLNYNYFLNNEKINLFSSINNLQMEREELLKNCPGCKKTNEDSKKNIIVYGDSHAADLYMGFLKSNNKDNYYYIANNANCMEILSKNKDIHFFEKFTETFFNKKSTSKFEFEKCYNDFESLRNLISKIDGNKKTTILFSMDWDEKEIKYLPFFFDRINSRKINIIIVSKRLAIPKYYMTILRSKNFEKYNQVFRTNLLRYEDFNKKLSSIVDKNKVKYVDLNKYICPKNNEKCIFISKNNIKYLDENHFNPDFSKLMINKINKYID